MNNKSAVEVIKSRLTQPIRENNSQLGELMMNFLTEKNLINLCIEKNNGNPGITGILWADGMNIFDRAMYMKGFIYYDIHERFDNGSLISTSDVVSEEEIYPGVFIVRTLNSIYLSFGKNIPIGTMSTRY